MISNFTVFLCSIFLFMYMGTEVGYGGWIPTYSVIKNLKSPEEAGYGTFLYFAAVTVG